MLGKTYKKGEEIERVRELVQAVLSASARAPEEVRVSLQSLGERVTFVITASPFDNWGPLAEEGSTEMAVQTIVQAMAHSLGMKFALRFVTATPHFHSSSHRANLGDPKVTRLN